MEGTQAANGDETFTKAQVAKIVNRHTAITVAAMIFGLMVAQSVNEVTTGQAAWLRFLVLVVAAGFAGGIYQLLMSKLWPAYR